MPHRLARRDQQEHAERRIDADDHQRILGAAFVAAFPRPSGRPEQHQRIRRRTARSARRRRARCAGRRDGGRRSWRDPRRRDMSATIPRSALEWRCGRQAYSPKNGVNKITTTAIWSIRFIYSLPSIYCPARHATSDFRAHSSRRRSSEPPTRQTPAPSSRVWSVDQGECVWPRHRAHLSGARGSGRHRAARSRRSRARARTRLEEADPAARRHFRARGRRDGGSSSAHGHGALRRATRVAESGAAARAHRHPVEDEFGHEPARLSAGRVRGRVGARVGHRRRSARSA